ncbi:MAG: hypothetical protein MUD12_05040 [Spirochaetes bacterium]|jgi:hypothetical protein|nr:hypothetical protein [Spirochaetota bacterium]
MSENIKIKKKIHLTVRLAAVAAALFAAADCYAYGLGAYFNFGEASYKSKGGSEIAGMQLNVTSVTILGGGLMFDSCLFKDRLINYRLGINFGSYAGVFSYGFFNTLGFGLIRSESIRLWAGPQIGLRMIQDTQSTQAYYNVPAQSVNYIDGVFDAGLAFGTNVRLSKNIAFILEGGFRYGFHFGVKNVKNDSRLNGYEGYINIGLAIPINDGYAGVASSDDDLPVEMEKKSEEKVIDQGTYEPKDRESEKDE